MFSIFRLFVVVMMSIVVTGCSLNVPTTSTEPQAPQQTLVLTNTPEQTPVPTNTPEQTQTPANTPEQTSVPTNTPEQTPVPTNTPEQTQTPSNTPEQTPVPTNTPEQTQVPTNTPEQMQAPVNTPEQTQAPVNTPEQMQVPTNTPEQMQAPTNTPEQMQAPTNTPETLTQQEPSTISQVQLCEHIDEPKFVLKATMSEELIMSLRVSSWSVEIYSLDHDIYGNIKISLLYGRDSEDCESRIPFQKILNLNNFNKNTISMALMSADPKLSILNILKESLRTEKQLLRDTYEGYTFFTASDSEECNEIYQRFPMKSLCFEDTIMTIDFIYDNDKSSYKLEAPQGISIEDLVAWIQKII